MIIIVTQNWVKKGHFWPKTRSLKTTICSILVYFGVFWGYTLYPYVTQMGVPFVTHLVSCTYNIPLGFRVFWYKKRVKRG